MKYQKIKAVLFVMCMLAAGICYSCNTTAQDLNQADAAGGGDLVLQEINETETTEVINSGETDPVPAPLEPVVYYYVHICGEVVTPGVYELKDGSRVFQAVEAAGGFTSQAATEYLNMAQLVTDGMKLVVPSVTEAKAGQLYGESDSGVAPVQAEGKVNLNTATKEQLMTLKGIGESRAEDIIQYREEQGRFQKTEDIMKISGIKNAAYEKIKDDITV